MKLRIPPVLQFFLCGALAMLVSHYLPSLSYDSSILKIPAYVIGTAGILLLLTAVAAFVKARTTVNPHKPETASKLQQVFTVFPEIRCILPWRCSS